MGHTTEITFRIKAGKESKNPHFHNFCKRVEESELHGKNLESDLGYSWEEDFLEKHGGFFNTFFHPSVWDKNLPDFCDRGGNMSFSIGVNDWVLDPKENRRPVDTYVQVYERENNGLWWDDCLKLSTFLHERLGFDVEVIFWEDGGQVAFIKNTDHRRVYKNWSEYSNLSESLYVKRVKNVCNWLMEVSDPDFHFEYLSDIEMFLLGDDHYDNWLKDRELIIRK